MINTGETVVLASNNAGKLREFRAMFEALGIDVRPQSEFDIPEVEETGLSFVENSILKARNAAQHSGLPAIADDSGIEIDALEGAPGIYSARFAGPACDDAANNALMVEKLAGLPAEKRTARYRACLVYMRHAADPSPVIADGAWNGVILETPRGDNGFGYDPYFLVPELDKSAAELPSEVKNSMSHRAKALVELVERIKAAP